MSTCAKSGQSGFSLIELIVGVLILGILASVAIPNFQSWMRNTQVRNAAESISNGLQLARAEAVSRNSNTRFVMCSVADTSWDVLAVSATAVAQSCTVDAVAPTGWERVQSRAANEGSKNVTPAVLPLGATTITFNNFGGIVTPNADGSAPFTQFDLSAVDSNKKLRVTIGVGGNTRMCDPNLAPNSSPSAC